MYMYVRWLRISALSLLDPEKCYQTPPITHLYSAVSVRIVCEAVLVPFPAGFTKASERDDKWCAAIRGG